MFGHEGLTVALDDEALEEGTAEIDAPRCAFVQRPPCREAEPALQSPACAFRDLISMCLLEMRS